MHIDFELANACNYRCSFCPYSLKPSLRPRGFNVSGSKVLDIALVEKILKEANGRLYAVELGYNTEPLLHPQVMQIAAMCRDYGVLDIRMGTNGSLLGKINYQEIIDSGVTQLQVSIDAVDSLSYARARNSSNYDEVVNNLKLFLTYRDKVAAHLPRIRVTYVKTPDNAPRVDEFIEQWRDTADIIGVQDLISYPDVQLSVSAEDIGCTDISTADSCYMPKVRLSIRSDGTVHPCCTVPGMKLKVGDAKKQTIAEIWNSSSMRLIRASHYTDDWKKNKICASCIENTSS
jgi:radical SAM protein with 4Fe4S-binding SPASM domain